MCAWVASVCVCVYAAGALSIGKAREWQDWLYKGGMELEYTKKDRQRGRLIGGFETFLESKSVWYQYHVLVEFLCPTIHSLLPLLPSHTNSSITPANQPSVAENKDAKQSTKGAPVQLVWWQCCGESFLLTCSGSEV